MSFGQDRNSQDDLNADFAYNNQLANAPKYYDPDTLALLPAADRLGVTSSVAPGKYDSEGNYVPTTGSYDDYGNYIPPAYVFSTKDGRNVLDQAGYDAAIQPYMLPSSTAYGGDWSKVVDFGNQVMNKYGLTQKQLKQAFDSGLNVTGADLSWMAAPMGLQILSQGLESYDPEKFKGFWDKTKASIPNFDSIAQQAQQAAGAYGTARQQQNGGDDFFGDLLSFALPIALGAFTGGAGLGLGIDAFSDGVMLDTALGGADLISPELGALGLASDLPSTFDQMLYEIGIDPSSISSYSEAFGGNPLADLTSQIGVEGLDGSQLAQKFGKKFLTNIGQQALRGKKVDPSKALTSSVVGGLGDIGSNALNQISNSIGANKMGDEDFWNSIGIDPSSFSGPGAAYGGDPLGGLDLSIGSGVDPVSDGPMMAGAPGAPVSYDYTPDSVYGPPRPSSAGGLGTIAQKLGMINKDGSYNISNILKAIGSGAAIYDKMATGKKTVGAKGTALAQQALQPASMFYFPGTALNPVDRSRFGPAKPRQMAARGGLAMACGGGAARPMMFADGGGMHPELLLSGGGEPAGDHFVGFVSGQGGGQDDNIPAMLSPGEYVFDAETVAAIGDGNTEEGARRLDEMRERIRAMKRQAPTDEIPEQSGDPMAFLGGE